MIDATPSAAPTPAQPVATVTSPEAPFPPPDPLPYGATPAVTDPVSYPDFLPVDDAFALEFRSESIEQLAGGDALRRGESERIEAGRSQTNADLVAGRDRVRVHATLHEHTGHGLAEQGAHLHTTVDGKLDVHAGNEDTVLLAGHMSDLWDGGAAIVAAMTDDTAAGGGIRVTAPLDLWVHGLMGVEERIGTCTADGVLMESSATHYEREYGPGVHAAGLAVYTGALYQSSRSSFRPLMRVSSGVRNLIAGGDGGGDGGGGGGDGAGGSAPAASSPPVPAETGAASESATGTLAAGRRAAEAPAPALDTADALTDARQVPREELLNPADARATEGTGEAGTMMRAKDVPELTRAVDTAEQLGALQKTLRMDATEAASEAAGGFRASEFEGAVSMHPASSRGGPLEIDTPSAVYGENALMVRPHPDVPWGQGQKMKLRVLGGADRPPRPAVPESDFHAVYSRLRDLRNHFCHHSRTEISYEFDGAVQRVYRSTVNLFTRSGGKMEDLPRPRSGVTTTDHACIALQEMARQADRDDDPILSGAIRVALDAITKRAVEDLEALSGKYGMTAAPSTLAMPPPPRTAGPTVAVSAIPPPARTPIQYDWITTYWQLRDLAHHFLAIGPGVAYLDFRDAATSMSNAVSYRLKKFGENTKNLHPLPGDVTKSEQAYRALEGMSRRAVESGDTERAYLIRQELDILNQLVTSKLEELTRKYGALDALSTLSTRATRATRAEATVQSAPTRIGPKTSAALPVTFMPPVTGGAAQVPVSALDPGSVVNLAQVPGTPGQPLPSSLPGPSLSEAGGTEVGSPGHWRLDPPASAPGTTAAHPVAAEAIVTPSLSGTSSFWLQPVDSVPATGSVPFGSGLHHAGETVRPPPATTTESSAAPAPGAVFRLPSWVDDNFDVERALLAGQLPQGFDVSQLNVQTELFPEFGLARDLAAGQLPIQTIDNLMFVYQATDVGGRNRPCIEFLRSLKESIERALHDAYPGRVDADWLDLVRKLGVLRRPGEPAPRSTATATVLPEFDVAEIDRFFGTGEGAPHSAPLPSPSAPWRPGAGAVAPPPAADLWRIRPPGMGGAPRPIAFDPWSAPPGPSSRVGYTRAIRVPVISTGAPPRRQGAETPGFARAASGAVEVPFSHREAIALRFRADDALLQAELVLQTGGGEALGWSATRWRPVLADIERLHDAIVRSDSTAAAARIDVDWRAIEALMRILDDPAPSP